MKRQAITGRASRTFIVAMATVAVAACSTPSSQVRVDQAEGGLPACRTFAWNPNTQEAATFSDQRMRAAVMRRLQSKGYEQATEKADCRIAYQLSSREIPKAKPGVGVGVGGGSGGVGGGIGISLPIGRKKGGYSGTFTLDIIDNTKNAQVWSGSVDTELKSAEVSDSEAEQLANDVLAAYPDSK